VITPMEAVTETTDMIYGKIREKEVWSKEDIFKVLHDIERAMALTINAQTHIKGDTLQ